jgi:hypothetical protein
VSDIDSKKLTIPGGTVSMVSPLLGTRTRRLGPGRMVVRQGDEIVCDVEEPQSPGLDPHVVEADWYPDPWFTRPLPEGVEQTLDSAGFGSKERRLAADGLQIAYPHHVCQDMAADESRLEIIYRLYEPFVLSIIPLLPLGLDLHACQPHTHGRLLDKLRHPETFWATEREVWAWARLVRAGLSPEVEPRGRGDSRPDFAIMSGGEVCFLEVKTNPMPDAERALWDLRSRVVADVDQIAHTEKFLHVMGTELLGDVFFQPKPVQAVMALLPELRIGFSQVHKAIRTAGYADGVYDGGRYVKARLASEPKELLGQTALDLWAGFSDKKLVARVLRKVREANSQVPRGQKAVVVVDIGGLKNLALFQDELKFEARARPKDFECVSTVVTVAMTSTPTNIRHELALALPPFEPVLTRLQRRVVEALLGRPTNQPPDWPMSSGESSAPGPFGRGTLFTCPLIPG